MPQEVPGRGPHLLAALKGRLGFEREEREEPVRARVLRERPLQADSEAGDVEERVLLQGDLEIHGEIVGGSMCAVLCLLLGRAARDTGTRRPALHASSKT